MHPHKLLGVNYAHTVTTRKIGITCCTRAESRHWKGTKIDYKCNRVKIIVVHIWKT